jgi:hypothetical protein
MKLLFSWFVVFLQRRFYQKYHPIFPPGHLKKSVKIRHIASCGHNLNIPNKTKKIPREKSGNPK